MPARGYFMAVENVKFIKNVRPAMPGYNVFYWSCFYSGHQAILAALRPFLYGFICFMFVFKCLVFSIL